MTLRRFLFGSLLFFATLVVASAQDDKLRVVYFEVYPPYSEGKGGTVHGLFVDVLNEVFARLQIKATHTGLPWARAQSLVETGEADAMVTLATPERLKYTIASNEAVNIAETRFYAGAHHPHLDKLKTVTSIEAAKPYIIGSYIGSGWVAIRMPTHHVEMTPTFEQTLMKLAASRVDLVAGVSDQTRTRILALGLEKDIVELPTVVDTWQYKLLVRKNAPFTTLLPQVDATLKAMREDGSLEKIYARYAKPLPKAAP